MKLKHLILILGILIICGCQSCEHRKCVQKQEVTSNNPSYCDSRDPLGRVWIDTITIHGKSHEILIRDKCFGRGGVDGMMYSLECWCQKECRE